MKGLVFHDIDGAIRSIAIVSEGGKLHMRPGPVPGYRVAELELPIAAVDDLQSSGLHASLRDLIVRHKVVGQKLVATGTKS